MRPRWAKMPGFDAEAAEGSAKWRRGGDLSNVIQDRRAGSREAQPLTGNVVSGADSGSSPPAGGCGPTPFGGPPAPVPRLPG